MSDRNTEKGAATMAKSEFVIKPGSNEISVTRFCSRFPARK